jgi:serine/threonine protein kinase
MNPFVAGSWVRGELFHGRKEILKNVLEGNRHALWLLGMRRVGKTSLLKQLEWLALQTSYRDAYLPVYWDMQGSNDLVGLRDSLFESIEDAEETLADHEIETASLEGEDVFKVLRNTMKAVGRSGRRLLLLCDEAEELIQVSENDDANLRKLRRLLLQGETIRCVLSATKRLGDVLGSRADATSPFLHGFLPPLYLSYFSEATAREVLQRGHFETTVIDEVVRCTGGHPYLLQLMGRRLYEGASIEQVTGELKADELVKSFFSVDFSYLVPAEKKVVLQVLEKSSVSHTMLESDSGYTGDYLRTLVHSLEMTGYLRQVSGNYTISNEFFHHWLRSTRGTVGPETLSQAVASVPMLLTGGSPEGQKIAQYSIVKTLGMGGMGTVYLAIDTHLSRQVAIKIINAPSTPASTARERFAREARTISSLSHPGIVTVYEFNEVSGVWYLAMELVEGASLRDVLERSPQPLPAEEVLRRGAEIASILAYAHEAGVIHRDIKPANIMISTGGGLKILDFGLAKILRHDAVPGVGSSPLTTDGQVIGTVAYMSPEQARGGDIGPETDQFSLGVVLYEMLAGRRPFEGPTDHAVLYQILFEEPRPLEEWRPDLPAPIRSAVEKLIRKEPAERYPTMQAAADALRKAAEALATDPSPLGSWLAQWWRS